MEDRLKTIQAEAEKLRRKARAELQKANDAYNKGELTGGELTRVKKEYLEGAKRALEIAAAGGHNLLILYIV